MPMVIPRIVRVVRSLRRESSRRIRMSADRGDGRGKRRRRVIRRRPGGVWIGDGDDDGPARMACGDTVDRLGRLVERVGAIDDRPDLPGLDQPLRATRSSWFWVLTVGRACCLTTIEASIARTVRASLPPACPPPFEISIPFGVNARRSPGHRVVAHVVEDQVVAGPARGEVGRRVVDDVVGADRPDELEVPGAGHAGHLGAKGLRDLNGERADAPRTRR